MDLNFAAGSSFLSLPGEEQKRLMDYLLIYRKELPRLLAVGEAGRFAVIKGQEAAHVWDTADDAMQLQPFSLASSPSIKASRKMLSGFRGARN